MHYISEDWPNISSNRRQGCFPGIAGGLLSSCMAVLESTLRNCFRQFGQFFRSKCSLDFLSFEMTRMFSMHKISNLIFSFWSYVKASQLRLVLTEAYYEIL